MTAVAPVLVCVTAVVVLAGCGGHGVVELTTVRDGTGTPPPENRSEPLRPSSPTGSRATSTSSTPPARTGTPAQLLSAARAAFAAAPSVRVTGTAVRGTDAYVLDVRLAGTAGGVATIETSGQTVDVVRVGDAAYVGGDLAFWRSITGSEAKARRMVGSHLRTPVDAAGFAAYVRFTEPRTYAEVLPDPGRPATATAPSTIRGTPVVGVRDTAGSTLYLAASGPAYPVRLDGLTAGQVVFLDFSDYGAPVPLRTPPTRSLANPGSGS